MRIHKKLLLFIFLIVLNLLDQVYGQSEQSNENTRQNKRLSLFGFGTPSKPPIPDHPALSFFTQNERYQQNNDLLQILNLFTSRKSVESIMNEFWHNAPSVESCIACNILIKHMMFEYQNEETSMRTFFFRICELIQVNGEDNGEFCFGFTEIYAPQLFYILNNTRLSSEEICATLLTECLDHFHWFISPLFWEVKISERIDFNPAILNVQNGATNTIKEFMSPRDSSNETSKLDDQKDQKRSPPIPILVTKPLLIDKKLNYVPPAIPAKNYVTNYAYSNPNELFEGAKFLHLTDLHLDLLYSLHSSSYCGRILCCRKETNFQAPQPAAPLQANTKLRTVYDPTGSYQANLFSLNQTYVESNISKLPVGYWGSYGNCNLPLRTIKHMFHHLSKFVDQIDYVVFTGDSVSHNIWSTNRRQVIETNSILTRLIYKYLLSPKNAIKTDAYGRKISYQPKRLVPAVGNHESDVVSMFPSTSLENPQFSIAWLYRELYAQWKDFIPLDQVANFLRGGYYSVLISKNMKLIVLNTNTCYRLNFWTLVYHHDSDGQLTWLEQELYLAEKLNQYVHLIGHIAPDKKNCNAIWLHNFIQIVTRYQHLIKAQFYGHSHLDEVKIYYGGNNVRRMVNTRNIVENMHKEEHTEENIEALLDEIRKQSNVTNDETNSEKSSKRTKHIMNNVAGQQIKQLMNLESLQKQLQHLNKDLIFKNQITLTDKINGFHENPYPGYVKEIKKPISIAFLSPSATTYDDVNPAYKVYIIEETGYVANAKTYYADIEEANRNHIANTIVPSLPNLPQQLPPQQLPPQQSYPQPLLPSQNPKRNVQSEDEDIDEYEDMEIDESENKLSYSYAIPDKSYSYNYNLPKETIGNYHSPQNTAYNHRSQQGQQPTAAAYQSANLNYQNKQTVNKGPKTKDYAESSDDYNTKSSKSSYEQSSKSSYLKNNQLEQQQPLHYPVYEKITVQPKSFKKYTTYQNSYQNSPVQTKPYQLAEPQLSKSTGQYIQPNTVYNSQPKLNYTMNSAKPYQQSSAYTKPTNPNSNQELKSNYQKDPNSQTKSNYVLNQSQYQLKANSTYSSSKNTNHQSVAPNYQSNNYEQYKKQHYTQSSIDKYKQTNGLPGDIDYEFKQYDEVNQYNSIKPVVATKNNYQPAKVDKNQPTYMNKPGYQQNSYLPPKNPSNYTTPKVQNYQVPMAKNYSRPVEIKPNNYQPNNYQSTQTNKPNYSNVAPQTPQTYHKSNYPVTPPPKNYAAPKTAENQNYSKPLVYSTPKLQSTPSYNAASKETAPEYKQINKPVENRPSNYPIPQSNYYQSYSNYQTTTKPAYTYTEKPITNYQQPIKSNYENNAPPIPKYPTYGKYPETNSKPKYSPPSQQTHKPITANLTRPYVSNVKPTYNSAPQYQPASQGPKLEYEFVHYEFANEFAKKHPTPPPPKINPLPIRPIAYHRPLTNGYPQPYLQNPGKEYGLIYENELGNRYPSNLRIYPTEHDYRMMRMTKLHKELKWRLEYDFNLEYSIARSTPYDWVNFIALMRTDNALFGRFYRNLHRQSRAERWMVDCNEGCRQHLLDDIIIIDPLDF